MRSALHTNKKGHLRRHKRPKSREETPKEGSDMVRFVPDQMCWSEKYCFESERIMTSLGATSLPIRSNACNTLSLLWFCRRASGVMSRSLVPNGPKIFT
jgi:hypothetical protein